MLAYPSDMISNVGVNHNGKSTLLNDILGDPWYDIMKRSRSSDHQ